MPHLEAPEDTNITTLYCGGLDETVTEQDIKNSFYSFGELRGITMVPKQGCAFVQFTQRKSAEKAAEGTFNKLLIRGNKITIRWGKSQGKTALPGDSGVGGQAPALPPPEGGNFFGLGGAGGSMALPPSLPPPVVGGAAHYPSQDPSRMGAHAHNPQNQFQ